MDQYRESAALIIAASLVKRVTERVTGIKNGDAYDSVIVRRIVNNVKDRGLSNDN